MRDLLKWLKDFLNKPWLVLFFSVVVCFIVFYFEKMNFDNTITINDVIMLATFFGLLWYAKETQRMRKASEGLLNLERPVVDLIFERNHQPKIINIGRGAAYNCKLKAEVDYWEDGVFVLEINNFKGFLLSGEEFEFDFILETVSGSYSINQTESLFFRMRADKIRFKIFLNYIDITNEEITRIFQVNWDGEVELIKN